MGIPNHPISGGGLCAIGLGGHLLPYHPSRLLQPHRVARENGRIKIVPISREESLSAVTEAILSSKQGSIAILDGQPKRAISFAYRKFLAGLTNGVYIVPPIDAGVPAELTLRVLGERNLSIGFDMENTRTILSFGAPVLDGWGTLGQFSKIVRNRTGNNKLKVIQVESIHSRTAQLADQWVPVKPGTEAAFALAIANVLINEKLCDAQKLRTHSTDFDNGSGHSFLDLAEKFSPASVAERSGISEDKIVGIARELVSQPGADASPARKKPSLVAFGGATFSRDEQIIFMDLNILLGAIGTKGGLIPRTELPDPIGGRLTEETPLTDVPDHSVRVLILDGAESGTLFPWQMLEQKFVPNSPVVVSLSPYFSGIALHADYLIPSPSYLESCNDSPTPAGAPTASYSISTPILPAPKTVVEPLDVIRRISAATHSNSGNEIQPLKELFKNRIEKIFKQRRGFVFDASTGETVKLTTIYSSGQLMKILSDGGCWYDKEFGVRSSEFGVLYSFLGRDNHGFEKLLAAADHHLGDSGLVLLPYAANVGQSHQLMTKVYRESNLREPGNEASINPETANKLELIDGGSAVVKTGNGISKVKVKFDRGIMPGAIQVAVGPIVTGYAETGEQNILEVCKISNDSTWRITKAEIFPA
jgi:anaerobic selenocysteine-containing dehydrogenase